MPEPTLVLRRLSPWPRKALVGELVVGVEYGGVGPPFSAGAHVCHTLEDALILSPLNVPGPRLGPLDETGFVAAKVPRLTAIPAGLYRVRMTYSGRFKRWLPEILDVPQFTAIRLHGGNDADDTEGCILVGDHKNGPTRISKCAPALARVCRIVTWAERNGGCWLEITNPGGTT